MLVNLSYACITGVPFPGLTVPLLKGCMRASGHVTADLPSGFVADTSSISVLAENKWNWVFYLGEEEYWKLSSPDPSDAQQNWLGVLEGSYSLTRAVRGFSCCVLTLADVKSMHSSV